MPAENPQISLSELLMELSDALEELAVIIARQKSLDLHIPSSKLRVITQRVSRIHRALETEQTTDARARLHRAYRKGFLHRWLIERGVHVGQALNNIRVDKRLYDVANYLADHYHQLKDFYKQLKRSQAQRLDKFRHVSTRSVLNYIRRWAEMLINAKLIDAFQTVNQQTVEVDTALLKEATAFITGMWLEVLLRREVADLIHKEVERIHSFDVLSDIHLTLPNGKAGELDLLLMLNERVFWFECKSGQIGKEYYQKYGYVNRRILQLSAGHAFLLLPQIGPHQIEIIQKRTGMVPLSVTDLDNVLHQRLFPFV